MTVTNFPTTPDALPPRPPHLPLLVRRTPVGAVFGNRCRPVLLHPLTTRIECSSGLRSRFTGLSPTLRVTISLLLIHISLVPETGTFLVVPASILIPSYPPILPFQTNFPLFLHPPHSDSTIPVNPISPTSISPFCLLDSPIPVCIFHIPASPYSFRTLILFFFEFFSVLPGPWSHFFSLSLPNPNLLKPKCNLHLYPCLTTFVRVELSFPPP